MQKTMSRPAGPVLWLDRFSKSDSEEIVALARRFARRKGMTAKGLLAEIDRALCSAAYGLGGRRGHERDAAWDRMEAFRDARRADERGALQFSGVVIVAARDR